MAIKGLRQLDANQLSSIEIKQLKGNRLNQPSLNKPHHVSDPSPGLSGPGKEVVEETLRIIDKEDSFLLKACQCLVRLLTEDLSKLRCRGRPEDDGSP